MRFFTRVRDLGSPENDQVAARLSAVTSRGKSEVCSDFGDSQSQRSVERRFWSPDEVAADDA